MDDIFYLLESKVTSYDICGALKSIPDVEILIAPDGSAFNVDFGSGIHTEWIKMEIREFECAELFEQIQTVFCICHHPSCIKMILPELQKLLDKYGGQIGNDSDEFKPLFDRSNIMEFEYEWNL